MITFYIFRGYIFLSNFKKYVRNKQYISIETISILYTIFFSFLRKRITDRVAASRYQI